MSCKVKVNVHQPENPDGFSKTTTATNSPRTQCLRGQKTSPGDEDPGKTITTKTITSKDIVSGLPESTLEDSLVIQKFEECQQQEMIQTGCVAEEDKLIASDNGCGTSDLYKIKRTEGECPPGEIQCGNSTPGIIYKILQENNNDLGELQCDGVANFCDSDRHARWSKHLEVGAGDPTERDRALDALWKSDDNVCDAEVTRNVSAPCSAMQAEKMCQECVPFIFVPSPDKVQIKQPPPRKVLPTLRLPRDPTPPEGFGKRKPLEQENGKPKEEKGGHDMDSVDQVSESTIKIGDLQPRRGRKRQKRNTNDHNPLDTTLREKYLQNPDLTLSLAINQGQAAEASQKQLRNIEKDSIDAIRKNFNEKYKPTTSLKNSYTRKCPAYGKECYKCRQPNHFSNCCKNRAVRCIQEIEEEKDNLLIIDLIMVGQVLRKPWKELIYIQGHPVDVKLDIGADVNILPERLIKEWPNMPLLETADCKIYTYTGQQIPVVGKCQLDCKTKYACRKVTFLIVNNSAVPILGLDECVNLNLVKRVETISEISVTLTGLLDEYKDVFKGNGHLSYIYDIKISDKAEPKISPARRLPRALLQPVKEELFKMEEDGIIEKIGEPTIFCDIPNVVCYIDDLQIWGNSIEDHNSTLKKVLDLARESRLKLTLNKLQMATGVVKFLGHTISQEGIFPDQDKVRAIQNMQIPKNKQELQRILGTVTYLAKFIPDLSSNTSNMRNLLKKDIIWNWNIAEDQELNFIKTLLSSPPVLRPFDPNEPLELFADASKDGHFLPQEQMEDKELDLCTQTFVLNVEIKDQRLTRLQEDTLNDKECCLLKQYILTGLPLHKKNLPSNLKPYWEFKEELHEWQNLICRGNKLLIPKTQRSDILKILHASHQGRNNTIALAKGFIYWPGIDIFQIESLKYLLIVDYFSKYPEIYQLQDMTTDTIIRRLKRTFSNFGIPETLVCDNGPPFFSKEFQNFTRTWNIVHVTSSPYHAQSNRMVERTVQTLKKLIKRCGEESTDPYLALLNLRNTPQNNLPSPAQIMMSRKLRHTRPADPLSIKDRVWFQKDKRWIPGQITNQAHEPRSFYVKDQEGNEYRRNSIHIREDKRNETTHTDWEKPLGLSQEQANFQDLEESTSQHSTQPTSSGQLSSPGSPKNVTTPGPPEN
ncbi:K02A2.6-like [Cordylochernes scorpioides]|uniref:K02A2.6-like n=1 Tax=Cordylochernes scorpioides TaxID=51811 RepID=A0ABY6LK41_9ARAC|nr:K02A2.6-like [Cordylochernes scorpioides]